MHKVDFCIKALNKVEKNSKIYKLLFVILNYSVGGIIKMKNFLKFVSNYKRFATVAIAILVCICIVIVAVVVKKSRDNSKTVSEGAESLSSLLVSSEISSEAPSSEPVCSTVSENSSSAVATSSKVVTSAPKPEPTPPVISKPEVSFTGDYQYNTNLNIEDNVFMDSLIYTGYNMAKHRADGKMWTYILAKYKRGYGWLSNITYAGGSSGLETQNGKPDIKAFERGGFVCASFSTYVYFNYLPNVAGIDTSSLPRPENTRLADSWYRAALQWVEKGYSRSIDFTATVDPSTRYIKFTPKEDIPIGSIIIFRPYDTRNSSHKVGSHVVVYAGYKNGFHWVYHVGTKNGPEMCAVERMLYGPEAQWPMLVATTPSNIRMAAMLEVEMKDDSGAPVSGVEFSLKNKETGNTINLGKTDEKGMLVKEGLNYGEYTLVQSAAPQGYTAEAIETSVSLTTKNNSKNTVSVVNVRDKQAAASLTQVEVENISETTPSN